MKQKLHFLLFYFLIAFCVKAQDNSVALISSVERSGKIFVVLDVFDFTKMKNVTSLEINSTTITEIPAGVFLITTIEELKINSTGITVIPSDIKKLPRLRILNLSNTSVNEIPEEIEQLVHLPELHLPYIHWENKTDRLKKITKAKIILE